jgi:hypothetical protein
MSREEVATRPVPTARPGLRVRPRRDADGALPVPDRTRPADRPAPAVAPTPETDLACAPAVRRRRWDARRWNRRTVSPITVLAVAAICCALGGLAGNAAGANDARARLLAGARVMLWADVTTLPGEGGADPGGSPRVRVTAAAGTGPMVLERVLFSAGSADARPAVTLRPGQQASTDLVLHPDCGTAGTGLRLTSWGDAPSPRAVVRVGGSSLPVEVPLDLVGDPSALMISLLAPCSTVGTDGEAALTGP